MSEICDIYHLNCDVVQICLTSVTNSDLVQTDCIANG